MLFLRLTPGTNALFRPGWLERVWEANGGGGGFVTTLFVLYLCMVAVARSADRATLYTTLVPDWLLPQEWSIRSTLRFYLRTRTTLLRCVHVWPDHTPFSHLQMCHCFATGVTLQALLVCLFFDQRECSPEAVLFAAFVSGFAGMIVMVNRVLFKWANMHGRSKLAYATHKTARWHEIEETARLRASEVAAARHARKSCQSRRSELSLVVLDESSAACGGRKSMASSVKVYTAAVDRAGGARGAWRARGVGTVVRGDAWDGPVARLTGSRNGLWVLRSRQLPLPAHRIGCRAWRPTSDARPWSGRASPSRPSLAGGTPRRVSCASRPSRRRGSRRRAARTDT